MAAMRRLPEADVGLDDAQWSMISALNHTVARLRGLAAGPMTHWPLPSRTVLPPPNLTSSP
jgi:hypothetical protein